MPSMTTSSAALFVGRDRDPILVLFAVADEADSAVSICNECSRAFALNFAVAAIITDYGADPHDSLA